MKTHPPEFLAEYEAEKLIRAQLDTEYNLASAELKRIAGDERGPMGLTPDHIKALPEWQEAKRATGIAFQRVRSFNGPFIKRFGKLWSAELHEKRYNSIR